MQVHRSSGRRALIDTEDNDVWILECGVPPERLRPRIAAILVLLLTHVSAAVSQAVAAPTPCYWVGPEKP